MLKRVSVKYRPLVTIGIRFADYSRKLHNTNRSDYIAFASRSRSRLSSIMS